MKQILNIISVLILVILFNSCSVLGLIQSKKEITGDYVLELHPESSYGYYDMSINVIQGIAAFEDGFFTSQTSANKYLSINFLNDQGKSVFNKRFNIVSHGQDLSWEQASDSLLYLYTSWGHFNKKAKSGILRIKVKLPEKVNGKRDMSQLEMEIDKVYNLHLDNATPTINEEKTHFAVRSANDILIINKENLFDNDLQYARIFHLDQTQLKDENGKTLWFQGIAMKDDKVYCVTGNNSIDSPKYLYVYNINGEVLKKYQLNKNDFAKNIGHKYEPEGITFKNGDLYYTVMTKANTGGNRKFLFKLK